MGVNLLQTEDLFLARLGKIKQFRQRQIAAFADCRPFGRRRKPIALIILHMSPIGNKRVDKIFRCNGFESRKFLAISILVNLKCGIKVIFQRNRKFQCRIKIINQLEFWIGSQ